MQASSCNKMLTYPGHADVGASSQGLSQQAHGGLHMAVLLGLTVLLSLTAVLPVRRDCPDQRRGLLLPLGLPLLTQLWMIHVRLIHVGLAHVRLS